MNIVDYWNISGNFWEANPQLIAHPVLKLLHKGDKTRGKKESSRIMWAVALATDFSSKYKGIEIEGRKDLIAKEYLEDPKFDWDSVQKYIDVWITFLSPAQKHLVLWERILQEKSLYMETLNYAEHGMELEKMLKTNGDLYSELTRLNKMLAEEEGAGHVKGGAHESLSETGEI